MGRVPIGARFMLLGAGIGGWMIVIALSHITWTNGANRAFLLCPNTPFF
jgi:hypothetical protein